MRSSRAPRVSSRAALGDIDRPASQIAIYERWTGYSVNDSSGVHANRATGSFVLIDEATHHTVAAGMISEVKLG